MKKVKLILSIIVFSIGWIPLSIFSGWKPLMINLENNQILLLLTGLIWGFIPTIVFSNFDEIVKNKGSKLIGKYDPLFGNPSSNKEKIRKYDSEDELLSFDKLLELNKVKEIKILSITSYVLILRYINQIKEAIENDVKFTFLLLNPDSPDIGTYVKTLIGGSNLKCQIESTIEELCKIKREIDTSKRENLKIAIYDEVEPIGESIMIVNYDSKDWFRRKRKEKTWIKVKITSAAIERPIRATYSNGNEKMYNRYISRFNKLFTQSKEVCID